MPVRFDEAFGFCIFATLSISYLCAPIEPCSDFPLTLSKEQGRQSDSVFLPMNNAGVLVDEHLP
jgi:hypothetical protein